MFNFLIYANTAKIHVQTAAAAAQHRTRLCLRANFFIEWIIHSVLCVRIHFQGKLESPEISMVAKFNENHKIHFTLVWVAIIWITNDKNTCRPFNTRKLCAHNELPTHIAEIRITAIIQYTFSCSRTAWVSLVLGASEKKNIALVSSCSILWNVCARTPEMKSRSCLRSSFAICMLIAAAASKDHHEHRTKVESNNKPKCCVAAKLNGRSE